MNDFIKMKEISKRIYKFLDKYAAISPNFDKEHDDEDAKFTSPDASMLKYCADMFSKGMKPSRCWSEWSGGGYKPYSSKEGREEHDNLMKDIYSILNK